MMRGKWGLTLTPAGLALFPAGPSPFPSPVGRGVVCEVTPTSLPIRDNKKPTSTL